MQKPMEDKGKGLAVETEGKSADELRYAVMGISGDIFDNTMNLLHDLTSHFRGESYTIVIDVTPKWVYVRKVPKDRVRILPNDGPETENHGHHSNEA